MPFRNITRIRRSYDFSDERLERLVRAVCAYMGFEIEVGELGRFGGISVYTGKDRTGEWPLQFNDWRHFMFGRQPRECDYEPSFQEYMCDYIGIRNYGGGPVYGKYAPLISESVQELEFKLAALGY